MNSTSILEQGQIGLMKLYQHWHRASPFPIHHRSVKVVVLCRIILRCTFLALNLKHSQS